MKSPVKSYLAVAADVIGSLTYLAMCKLVFRDYGFPYAVLLTSLHFCVTFLALLAGLALRLVKFQRLDGFVMCGGALVYGSAVALDSLSLLTNSTTMYLLMRVSMSLVFALEPFFTRRDFGGRTSLSIAVILFGTAVANGTDLELTFLGTLTAVSAGVLRQAHESAMAAHVSEQALGTWPQLLLYQAPIAAILLTPLAFFADNLFDNLYMPCTDTTMALFFSGGVAAVVHLSPHWVATASSKRSRALAGHVKLLLGLLLGVLLLDGIGTKMHYGSIAATFLGAASLPLPR